VRLCCAGTVSGSSSDAHSQRGTESSNPPPSSGKSTNHRFLGGGAASAVCHEPAPLYPELRPKVADFISWWIDPVSGRPIPERAGVLRYFVRIAEKIVWADRPEDSSRSTPRVRGGARSSDDGRAIRSSPDSPLGEVVRVFNARGACFAGVSVTEAVRPASFGSPAAPGTTPRATRTSRPAPILPSSRQPSRDPAPQPAGYPDKADAAERFRPTLRWREPDSNSGSRRERPTAG
jgi:hypothetical protein